MLKIAIEIMEIRRLTNGTDFLLKIRFSLSSPILLARSWFSALKIAFFCSAALMLSELRIPPKAGWLRDSVGRVSTLEQSGSKPMA